MDKGEDQRLTLAEHLENFDPVHIGKPQMLKFLQTSGEIYLAKSKHLTTVSTIEYYDQLCQMLHGTNKNIINK